jgi:hypothetical protein
MNSASAASPALPLALPALIRRPLAIVLGSLLVAVCAHISIPLWFTPVPVTLQTFAVLLLGLFLSPSLSAAALLLYLIEGAIGLPRFQPVRSGRLPPSPRTHRRLPSFLALRRRPHRPPAQPLFQPRIRALSARRSHRQPVHPALRSCLVRNPHPPVRRSRPRAGRPAVSARRYPEGRRRRRSRIRLKPLSALLTRARDQFPGWLQATGKAKARVSIELVRGLPVGRWFRNSYEAIADRISGISWTRPRRRATTRTPSADCSMAIVWAQTPQSQ